MNEHEIERFEDQVRAWARTFHYPPTPNLVARTSRPIQRSIRFAWTTPRLAWSLLAVLLVVCLATLAVPAARATVFEIVRLGAVRILLGEPTPAPRASPTSPSLGAVPSVPDESAAPFPTAAAIDFAGETTLDSIRERVSFDIRLPTYPSDLGPPDRVFYQDWLGDIVLLVWTDPSDSRQAVLSLHILEQDVVVEKSQPQLIESTEVNGQLAFWTTGPYQLVVGQGEFAGRRLIEGHVLIWTEDGLTYRLETDLPLEEAVRVAESLR